MIVLLVITLISKLPDKKIAFPSYDANQSVERRKPTADDDLNFSYLYFREKQCLTEWQK